MTGWTLATSPAPRDARRTRGHRRATRWPTRRPRGAGSPARSTSSTRGRPVSLPGRAAVHRRRPGPEAHAFVPGASFPASPPPPEVPAGTPIWGSFLVPEAGTTADARIGTFTTDWFRLPAATTSVSGSPSPGAPGRTSRCASSTGAGLPTGSRRWQADRSAVPPSRSTGARSPWSTRSPRPRVRTSSASSPPTTSTTTGGWLAFTAPTAASLGAAAGVLPSRRPRRRRLGDPDVLPVRAPAPPAGRGHRARGRRRSGSAGRSTRPSTTGRSTPRAVGCSGTRREREGPGTLLTIRVRDVGAEVRDLWVLDLRPPYPTDGYALTRERRTMSGMPEEGVDLDPPPPLLLRQLTDEAPVEDHLHLPVRELVTEGVLGPVHPAGDLVPLLQLLVHVLERQDRALVDLRALALVGELEREDPEVGQVLPVDAGEGLGDHDAQAEVARADRGVLAGRALAVVGAADDGVPGRVLDLLGVRRVVGVDPDEGELRQLRDVRAVRQRLRTGRGDVVGGDVVADREQHRHLEGVGERVELRQPGDVRALDQLLVLRLLRGRRLLEHVRDDGGLGQVQVAPGEAELLGELAGVGDLAGQRAGGRGLRRAQPDLVVLAGAGAAGEVAGEGPQGVACRARGPGPCRCSPCSRTGGCGRRPRSARSCRPSG